MPRTRKLATCDCETDPFDGETIPRPFVWGYFDGKDYLVFHSTEDFVAFIRTKRVTLYAHNGGKFDFMLLMSYMPDEETTAAQVINGRIVSMNVGECRLVDSYAAVPESLKNIKKDEIEYWKMTKENRAKYMAEIVQYLRGDCVYLYELMAAYRKAAGTKTTIASNALARAKELGIDPGKTNHRFDRNYREFYFGGRTQCFRPGSHERISVFDIKSSYPRAMQEFHPTGNSFHRASSLDGLTREEIQRAFIVVECHADGCFPIRDMRNIEGLTFPRGRAIYKVTGWEYLAAMDLGLIDDEKILSVRYCKETITFADYVQHWYAYKKRHSKKTDPINYTIGKIMMNSLYGKLAQNPERYHDYKIVPNGAALPCNSPRPDKDGVCKICLFKDIDHGWTYYTQFEGKTFHRRESLWKHRYRYGIEWESKPLYKNVATGASITGYARAALLRAMHAVGIEHVIYCDTDSLVVDRFTDMSILPQSDKIGDWEREISDAPIGHFCGKKLYGIDIDPSAKCGCADRNGSCKRHKVVTKGGRLTFREIEKIVAGEEIGYHPAAPSFSLARGINFGDRTFRRTAQ
jgi:DNA polymerase elongation subunit (family B)